MLGALSRRATPGPKSARRTRPGHDAPRAFPPGQAGAEGTPCFLPLSSATAQAGVGVLEGAGSGDPDAGPGCFWLSSMLPTSGRQRRRCHDDHARAPAPSAAAEELQAVWPHLVTPSAYAAQTSVLPSRSRRPGWAGSDRQCCGGSLFTIWVLVPCRGLKTHGGRASWFFCREKFSRFRGHD